MKIVTIKDRFDSDSHYYRVVTDSAQEVGRLIQQAKQAGLAVEVAAPDSYESAMRFIDGLIGSRKRARRHFRKG